jgi:hypothetical protein
MRRAPDIEREEDLREQTRFRIRPKLRERALKLLGQGIPPLVVARRIGTNVSSVHRWKKQKNSGEW